MLLSVLSVTAGADTATYSGTCGAEGDNVTWEIDLYQDTLFINGIGDMADYGRYSAPWNSYEDYPGFSSIVVGEGVTSIGDNAFIDLSDKKITLSSTVEELGIGSFFRNADIVIVENNPHLKIDDYGVIYSKDGKTLLCASKGIGYAYAVPEGVEEFSPYAFDSGLSEIVTSRIDIPSSVKNIPKNAFFSTFWIPHITPHFVVNENNPYYSSDEYGVLFDKDKEIIYAIPDSLNNYIIPETVKEIADYAFYDKEPNKILITKNITKIGSFAFFYAKDARLYIPKNVTLIADDFAGNVAGPDQRLSVYYEGTQAEWEAIYRGTNNALTVYFEHEHTNTNIRETCTQKIYTCSVCETTNVIEDIGDNHKWYGGPDYEGFYCVGGETSYTCNRCWAEKTEYIEPLGHNYQFVSDNNATCTEDGTKREVCSRCNATGETVVDVGSKLGHDLTETTVLSQQTCTQDGISVQACKRCAEIVATIEGAYGHFDNDGDGKCDECKVVLEVILPEVPSEPETDVTPSEPEVPEEPETPEEPQESTDILSKLIELFNKILNILKKLFGI